MSSVLIISENGKGVPLAFRLAQEGHIVKVCFKDNEARVLLNKGKNPTVVGAPKMLEQYDLVLFDDAFRFSGRSVDEIKREGKAVFGSCSLSEKLKEDINYESRVLDTMLNFDFKNDPTEEMFKVQLHGWFDSVSFRPYFSLSLPYERLMEGGKGPKVGCAGLITWCVKPEECELIKRLMEPLTPLLREAQYLGPVQVHCEVGEDSHLYPVLRCNFNYDHIYTWCELIKGPLFDFLWDLNLEVQAPMLVREDYALSVRLSAPPFPYQEPEMKVLKGLKIPEPAQKHFFHGRLSCVTARGSSVHEARRRVYRTIDNTVKEPEVQYRKDIGAGAEGKIEKLKTWGWLDA